MNTLYFHKFFNIYFFLFIHFNNNGIEGFIVIHKELLQDGNRNYII